MALPEWMVFEDDGEWEQGPPEQPSYQFYNGKVKLYFDAGEHVYYRFDENGQRVNVDGVTTVLGIISKPQLVPWATKLCVETLEKYLIDADGGIKQFSTEELKMWLHEAKNKHRERLETAGDIGHIAHDCLEKSIQYAIDHTNGIVEQLIDLPSMDTPEQQMARNCAFAAWDWMRKHNVRWVLTERKIYSLEYDFAGTEDGICVVDSCDDIECCRGRQFKDVDCVADWKSSNHLSDSYALQTAAYQFAQIEEFGKPLYDRWVLRLGKEDGKFEPWYLPADEFEADLDAFLAALQLYRSMNQIGERRKADRAHLREIIRQRKRVEREQRLAEERAERERVREEKKRATRERKAAAKALYKKLRAEGMSVDAAKAIAYPSPDVESEVEAIPPEPVPTEVKPEFSYGWTIQL